MGKGAEGHDVLTLGLGGRTQTFTIDGKGGEVAGALIILEPLTSDLVHFLRINTLEKTPYGGLTWGDVFAAFALFARVQGAQLILIEGLGKFADG